MLNRRHTLLVALLAVILISGASRAGSLEPPGPPAPTMKDLDDVEPRIAIRNDFVGLIPIVISGPGSYYLAEDIYAMFGQHGIEITAGNVTLDLNGFSVIGNTEVGSLDGIHGVDQEAIVIYNGTVRDFFETGIDLANSQNSRVDKVVAANNNLSAGLHVGINVNAYSQVIDSIAAGNGWTGIRVDSGSIIRGCIADNNAGHGLQATLSIVESSVSRGNDTGIDSSWSLIRGNNMSNNNLNLNNFNGLAIDNVMN